MSTQQTSSGESRAPLPWRKRASYKPAKSRRKRQKQLREQQSMLYVALGVTVVLGFVAILLNWQNAGATKTVSCESFPEYCVPMANLSNDYAAFEASGTRELDQESHGVAGVVRGMTEDNVPFIGDPGAPIHFRTVSNFACSHCNTYHSNDLAPFIEDYVMTGQATLGFVIVTTTAAPAYAEVASQAALCAGEQGAFWEMTDELYRLARAGGIGSFTMGQIGDSANDMGLNRNALINCVAAGKYSPLLIEHQMFMQDHGVSGTPTLLVRYAGQDEWTRIEGAYRGYANMAEMTERANAAQ